VIGGALDAATAADMLAVGWDQNGFSLLSSPAAVAAEEVAGVWLKELLGLPATASVGFVTGAQAANTVGLAAGRHAVLQRAGWDVEADGLAGAPAVRVVATAERHATVDRALRLLGLGTNALVPVATDADGALDVDALTAARDVAHERGAWVHVDGAFGLWAAGSPRLRALVDGVERADSWGCDGHKWLNVPYDCGYAFCAHPDDHVASTSYTASYLVGAGGRAPAGGGDLVLESSRRARGFATWAAIRELGAHGIAALIERNCELARHFADSLAAGGAEIANDIVLNQVLVGFGDDATTDAVIEGVQRDGTCWMGGTSWRGRRLMRISVSNWSTTADDVDRAVAALLRVAAAGR
jgi:glutamate/tyrosine decarboxylase-like PLP-dependent enzyme